MTKTVDYFLSLVSPYTYLGDALLTEIAARHGAAVRRRPMELAKIFPETGGLPLPKRAPARQAYRLLELERWREFRGLPLNLQPKFFPAREWPAAGMVIAAENQGLDGAALVNGILTAGRRLSRRPRPGTYSYFRSPLLWMLSITNPCSDG